MIRESNLDKQIDELCTEKKAVGRKIHGSPYQKKTVDWLICYKGRFIAIESKASNGRPDALQKRFLTQVQESGGIGEVAYSIEIVKAIFDSIDKGEPWIHGDYRLNAKKKERLADIRTGNTSKRTGI